MEDVTYSHKEMARLILRIRLRRLEIVKIGRQPQGLLEEGRPPTTNHLGEAHELHPPPRIA
jgi:hypothetical protein